jgi:hypothetical protein
MPGKLPAFQILHEPFGNRHDRLCVKLVLKDYDKLS